MINRKKNIIEFAACARAGVCGWYREEQPGLSLAQPRPTAGSYPQVCRRETITCRSWTIISQQKQTIDLSIFVPSGTTQNMSDPEGPGLDETVDPPSSGKAPVVDKPYKILAIKFKKELLKLREESIGLNERIEFLDKTNVNLEAKNKILEQRLNSTENDLQELQNEFENYKTRASEIMQQNNPNKSNLSHTFEDNLYKQLKEMNSEQQKRISILESQLNVSLEKNKEMEREQEFLQEKIDSLNKQLVTSNNLETKCTTLTRENDNLKVALKQFRSKLKDPNLFDETVPKDLSQSNIDVEYAASNSSYPQRGTPDETGESESITQTKQDHGSQSNSSSSSDGSTSGYVHIKPTTFEIISKSSLDDTQNQLDNLTKAYLDSESTNSLLTEQVLTLKEEIRRLERGTQRMELAENLEYLKNILFKFLTLDSGQSEQKERLIPVLSTVLKLSPEETTKLQTMTVMDKKQSMASSFFNL